MIVKWSLKTGDFVLLLTRTGWPLIGNDRWSLTPVKMYCKSIGALKSGVIRQGVFKSRGLII